MWTDVLVPIKCSMSTQIYYDVRCAAHVYVFEQLFSMFFVWSNVEIGICLVFFFFWWETALVDEKSKSTGLKSMLSSHIPAINQTSQLFTCNRSCLLVKVHVCTYRTPDRRKRGPISAHTSVSHGVGIFHKHSITAYQIQTNRHPDLLTHTTEHRTNGSNIIAHTGALLTFTARVCVHTRECAPERDNRYGTMSTKYCDDM